MNRSDVDVPARQHDADAPACTPFPVDERRSQRRCTTRLEAPAEQVSCDRHRVGDLALGDGQHDVDQLPIDLERCCTGRRHRQPVRNRGRRSDRDAFAGSERPACVVSGGRFDSDQLARRIQLPHRRRAARHQATAGHGHQERVEFTDLVVELEGHRALTPHHQRVLEGVDERGAGLEDLGACTGLSVGGGAVEADDAGAEPLDQRSLRGRHVGRDVHGGFDAEDLGGTGNCCTVVARRHRNDAETAVGVGNRREPVEGAAELE